MRSIVADEKREDLEILIEGIKPAPILFLTETWLKPKHLNILLPFASKCAIYRADRNDCDRKRGGGAVIMIPKCYPSMALNDVTQPCKFEAIWCKVVSPNQSINLGCVYRPPKSEISALNLSNYLDAHFKTNINPTVLAGDFNFPDIDWINLNAKNQYAQPKFLDLVNSLGLSQLIDFPTRGKNTLDLIFTNEPNLVQNADTGPEVKGCDHKTVVASLTMQKIESQKISYRNYANADYNLIAPSALNLNWDLIDVRNDINRNWNSFKSTLTELVNKFIPVKTIITNANCIFSSKTTKLFRQKYKLYWQYKSDLQNVTLKNKYVELSRLAQRQKRQDIISSENSILRSSNLQTFWKFIKSKLSYKASIPCILDEDGKTVLCDKIEKAERFNKYFCSVFSQDDNEIPNFPFPQSNQFISHVQFTPEIVYDKLNNLPNKNSCGPDNVPASLYKNLSVPLAEPLCKIFLTSFEQSRTPDEWKLANVVPIHKKGPTNVCGNYRPVSLECQASKIMESIVNDALLNHFKDKFSKNQHGFLKQRSTVTQLLETLNDWTQAIEEGKVIDVQYIDWAKAFDSISHSILIGKLRRYGVVGSLLDWIKAFLKDRKQRVIIDGCLSSKGKVTSSVPQGSVLSSTLFLIFINDLELVFRHSKIRLFADDSKYYIIFIRENSDQAKIDMQSDNQALVQWGTENKMRIAFAKCATLHLGYGNPANEYTFDDFLIPSVDEIRDLGVTVSNNLKFGSHIMKICKSASATSNLIYKCFHNRSRTFLKKLFQVYVRPKLEYASQVWNPYHIKDIDAIEKIQRKFTKRIPGLHYLPYSERLRILNLERLELRRIHLDLTLVYKIINKLIDLKFTDYFTLKTSNTRGHSLALSINRYKKDVRKFFFANRVINRWNFLNEATVNATSLNSFKNRLKDEDLARFIKGGGD